MRPSVILAPHTVRSAAGFAADVLSVHGVPGIFIELQSDPHRRSGAWRLGTGVVDRS